MLKNNLIIVVAVIFFTTFMLSCEDAESLVRESKFECEVDGIEWKADEIFYLDNDTILSITGVKGVDTISFSYEPVLGLVGAIEYVKDTLNYSMILAGIIEDVVQNEDELSGNFSEMTAYDNFFFPSDSVVISKGDFLVLK